VRSLLHLVHAIESAVRSIWAYRLRSLLTALGVMIGVATIISILSIIEGLNKSFREQIALLGTGTLYVSQRPWISLGDWWKYVKRPPVTRRDANYLEEHIWRARAVVPFTDSRVSVDVGRMTLGFVRTIGSTHEWPMMSGVEPIEGRFFSAGEVESQRDVVVAGADVVEAMRREGVSIGDRIRIAGHPFTVIGLMPSQGRIFGQSQDDFVVIALPVFERYFGNKRSVDVGVVVDPDELDIAAGEVTAALRVRRKLKPHEEDTFSINQQQVFVELYRELTRALFATAIGLGIITLIVGGVGIMNIMLVAVTERTREIGIRKALGARPRAILAQFVVEAGAVSGCGGAIGTVFGLLAAKAINESTPLPASVPPSAIAIGLAFGLFVGVTFGFLPAYRASRLLPVRALSAGD
jgi:putative ABC transport system permease protein